MKKTAQKSSFQPFLVLRVWCLCKGGRGGEVIKVTNLNAVGPGSLQEALNKDYPRIIIFSVSGVIKADKILIPFGNVTIAG